MTDIIDDMGERIAVLEELVERLLRHEQPATTTATREGLIELATQAEVDAGADAERAVTPATLGGAALDTVKVSEVWESDSGAVALQADADGNIGVDTASPERRFHIVGPDGKVSTFPSAMGTKDLLVVENNDTASMAFVSDAGYAAAIKFYVDGNTDWRGLMLYVHSTDSLQFGTNATLNRLVILSNGDVGVGTAAPGQIFDVNQGSGNMIADGYDTHSLGEFKENIEDVPPAGHLIRLKNLPLKKFRRTPFVSSEELVKAAMRHFGFTLGEDEDAREFLARIKASSDEDDVAILAWINQRRVALREERRLLPKWRRMHVGLVADNAATLEALPDVVSKNDEGEAVGISLNEYVGFLHSCVRELAEKVESLEGGDRPQT